MMNGQEFLIASRDKVDELHALTEQFAAATEERICALRPRLLAIDDETPSDDVNQQLDLTLLKAAPVAVVPRHSPFQSLDGYGHRFLLASDGLYLEVHRPWLYFLHRIAEQTAVAMPFGSVVPATELGFGRLSAAMDLIREFAAEARQALPNEHACLIAWDDHKNQLQRLQIETDATQGAVKYTIPSLDDHLSIAIDLHSHGHLPAFFSATDNADDAGGVKISGVIGELDTPTPSVMFRLCVLGLCLPIAVPADKIFGGN